MRSASLTLPFLLAAGCGAAPAARATPGAGPFSVVVGVPPEWALRVDQPGYLAPGECEALCPSAFRSRVSACHLARVTGREASPDTAAVVCNGGGAP